VQEKDMMHPIETAVMPLKDAAIARADKEAHALVERVRADLEKHAWDFAAAAPYPRSLHMSRRDYLMGVSKYKLYAALTRSTNAILRPKEPHIVTMHADKIAKFIQEAKENAADQYEAFVAKLCGKVGEVESATLSGDHVWSYSLLKVTKPDGATETWKTRMIINVSKLGKLFNQWPTRKVK